MLDGKPSLSHGTLVLVPLLSKGSLLFEKTPTWTAYIDEIDENAIKVQVIMSKQLDFYINVLNMDVSRFA